jgi:hypothetical protein
MLASRAISSCRGISDRSVGDRRRVEGVAGGPSVGLG